MQNSQQLLAWFGKLVQPEVRALPQLVKLSVGQVFSVRVQHAGKLWVTQGRVWATATSTKKQTHPVPDDDYFISASNHLALRAGTRVVLESWPLQDGEDTIVLWQ
jgi:hypothetical protein